MTEMTPEKLRARMSCGAAILPGGGDVYATWEEFCEVQQVGLAAASAWEADRSAKKLWGDAVNLTVEMLSQAVPPLTGGGLYRSVERLLKAYLQRQSRIEALEKELLYLAGEVAEGSDMTVEAAVIWARLTAALAAEEATGKHIVPPATATEIRNAIGCAPEDIEAGISALECQHLGTVNGLGQCSECHKPIVGGE